MDEVTESKPAKAPPGSVNEVTESKPAKAPPGSEPDASSSQGERASGSIAAGPRSATISSQGERASGSIAAGPGSPSIPSQGENALGSSLAGENVRSRSACEPFRDVILAKLDQGLCGQRIWQDLVHEHGFTARYHSVRRFVKRLGETSALPFRRLECGPGEEAQVDFGTAWVVGPDGKRRRPYVFRIVLSHSRKAYSEVVYRQTTENFVRCLEDAFWHFGGVPQRVVLDNLRPRP